MGQRRTMRNRRAAFTIIEVIVIVVILGVLATIIAPRLLNQISNSKQSVAKANAASLATQVKLFMAEHGPPESGAGVEILWERPGTIAEGKYSPYVDNPDQLVDPWGRKYILIIPGQRNVDFDIVSYGADGQPGGQGENADIVAP